MNSADIREKLKRGQPTVGTWLQIPSPDTAEIIGRCGYDWAAVDMEHGAFTRSDLPNICRALELGGTLPFARLREASRGQIKSALDSGARGLIFPMIESGAELDRAIREALYPGGTGHSAGGVLGVGFSRANAYGENLAAQTEAERGTGRDIVLAAQIEHVRALQDLDAIFANPRLDAYMVGPYDLSASMGLTGCFDHPDFVNVLAEIARKAEEHGKAKGFHVVEPDPADLRAKIGAGYAFIAYGIDAVFLTRAALRPPCGV
jgi:2-dehydro-3-deoxyglucarate aldolase